MRHKYKQIGENGTTIHNKVRFFLKCCDCGLVHQVCIVATLPRRRSIGIAMKRDDRKTSAERRQMARRKEGLFVVGFAGPITKRDRIKARKVKDKQCAS